MTSAVIVSNEVLWRTLPIFFTPLLSLHSTQETFFLRWFFLALSHCLFHKYCIWCHLITRLCLTDWLLQSLAFHLNFTWKIISQSNHRYPVRPHPHSMCLIKLNIPCESTVIKLREFVQIKFWKMSKSYVVQGSK